LRATIGLSLALIIVVTGSACASVRPIPAETLPVYPNRAEFDYLPSEVFARWALPRDGHHRVWVKGSAEWDHVRLLPAGGTPSEWRPLAPPYWTSVVTVDASSLEVEFRSADESTTRVSLATGVEASIFDTHLASEPTPFSILLYGCFQPFSAIRTDERDGQYSLEARVLAAPRDAAQESSRCDEEPTSLENHEAPCPLVQLRHLLAERVINPTRIHSAPIPPRPAGTDFQRSFIGAGPRPPVMLAVGNGDQLYLDAGYGALDGSNVQGHPLSLWDTSQTDPGLRIPATRYGPAIDAAYRAFWSFTSLDRAWHAVPGIMVWDDHDVRDGFGSHDDEHGAELLEFERLAREGYAAHQLSLYDDTLRVEGHGAVASERLTVGGVPVFVLDARGGRGEVHRGDVRPPEELRCECPTTFSAAAVGWDHQVVPASEFCELERLLRSAPSGEEVVIVSSTPLFWSQSMLTSDLYTVFYPTERDDIRDSWGSRENRTQRLLFFELLRVARGRDVRPILASGDIHMTVPIVAWDCHGYRPSSGCSGGSHDRDDMNSACRILAYEMVVTGLANEDFHRSSRGIVSFGEQTQSHPSLEEHGRVATQATVFAEKAAPNFGTIDFNPGSSTWLTWYSAEIDGSGITEERMEVDWNRQRCDDIRGGAVAALPRSVLWYH
jgi:hypothetical protein